MSRRLSYLLIALVACSGPGRQDRSLGSARDSADSAFALVQARGHTAMGVNQYTSAHRFEPLADGGRVSLQRDPKDSAGVAQVRIHMKSIAEAFARGDFALPGFVHDREVPGAAVMAALRSRIRYAAETLPGGAQLRLITADSAALAAIHEFLAFQSRDHRAGSGATH